MSMRIIKIVLEHLRASQWCRVTRVTYGGLENSAPGSFLLRYRSIKDVPLLYSKDKLESAEIVYNGYEEEKREQ